MTALRRVNRPDLFTDGRSISLAVAGGVCALVVGYAIASGNLVALAAVAGLVAGPLLVFDPALGSALWVPLTFVPAMPGAFGAERLASVLLVVAWVGYLSSARGVDVRAALARHRTVLALVAGFAVLLGLTVLWAQDTEQVRSELGRWYPALIIFAIVATVVSDRRGIVFVIYGLAAGALVSVAIGLGMPQLTNGHPSVDPTHIAEGRLHGAEADANLLAAAIIPVAALLAGLMALKRDPLVRFALLAAILFLVFGLVATQSRGGIVAAVVAVLVAIAVFRERRGSVLWVVMTLSVVVVAAATASPEAAERLTTSDERLGSGRGDIWRVGYAIAEDHPVLGVGLGNYVVAAPEYATQVGLISAGDRFLAGGATVVCNTFLQLLVEGGIFLLVAFMVVAWVCVRSALRAAAMFDADRDIAMATLARALVVGQAAILTSCVFLSNGTDKRLWVLLALGPAIESAARRQRAGKAVRADRPREAEPALA